MSYIGIIEWELVNKFVCNICQGKMKMKLINCEINEDEVNELLDKK